MYSSLQTRLLQVNATRRCLSCLSTTIKTVELTSSRRRVMCANIYRSTVSAQIQKYHNIGLNNKNYLVLSSFLIKYNQLGFQVRHYQAQGKGYDNYHKDKNGRKWYNNSDAWIKAAVLSSVSVAVVLGYKGLTLNIDCETSVDVLKKPLDNHELKKTARDILLKIKDEYSCPGIVVSVSVDGQEVWAEGIGYANIENQVPCHSDSVMRIASISKPITVALLAKLWEEGKLDLDKPVGEYVKYWPEKSYKGEKVTLTTRQLLSHVTGIRHYSKTCDKNNIGKAKVDESKKQKDSTDISKSKDVKKVTENKEKSNKSDHNEKLSESGELSMKEYYLKKNFPDVESSVSLFKDDELCFKPGTDFLYTTHGYTLISAVIEAVANKPFKTLLKQLLKELGLDNTDLDEHQTIVYNRANYYVKSKTGRLVNAPYVDISYKWAGGGLISSVKDIVKFGNIMLYSYQHRDCNNIPQDVDANSSDIKPKGYLKPDTVKMLWSPISHTGWDQDSGWYGMGWGIMPAISKYGCGRTRRFCVSHTGGAIGASSVLLVMPSNSETKSKSSPSKSKVSLPQGVVVGIIVNMQGVNLNPAALKIADIFMNDK